MTSESIYWLFTAAAQSMAGFFGFLIAGYALVNGIMEQVARNDETLGEIHDALKRRYYKQLAALSVVAGTAILLSLLTVALNGSSFGYTSVSASVSSVACLAAIVGGVLFVLAILDPAKYAKAARKLARAEAPAIPAASPTAFFDVFIELEKIVRRLWLDFGGGDIVRRHGRPSFREMLRALLLSEVVRPELVERLTSIASHRNLYFHGHVGEVDPAVIEEARQLLDALKVLERDARKPFDDALSERRDAPTSTVGDVTPNP